MSRLNWYNTLAEFEEAKNSLQYPSVCWIASEKMAYATPKKIIPDESQKEYDLWLIDAGATKIAVVKEIKAITDLGLKESVELVNNCPKLVKAGINMEEGEEYKKRIEAAGGKAELR